MAVRAGSWSSSKSMDVAIIGAGPYGLSIAAHLNTCNLDYRIFGSPMSVWAKHMPPGMKLKSEGFASSLSDPAGEFPLSEYCRIHGLPYSHIGFPVSLETFVAYGLAFQKRFVPALDERLVVGVSRRSREFELILDDGEVLRARRVISAVGISYFRKMPAELEQLPDDKVSHSSAYGPLERLRGKRVAIIGGGASAVDLAAGMLGAASEVHLIARRKLIDFHLPPQPRRTLWDRIRHPATGIGTGFKLGFYAYAPHLFRLLPETVRLDKVRNVLGPAPGWFVKEQVDGKVPMHLGAALAGAEVQGDDVVLRWTSAGEGEQSLRVDHVVAATGYAVDVNRMTFLSDEILALLRLTGRSPLLSAHFQSSVPGLYFVGLAAANTFGPLLRFACGAQFTARTLRAHFAKIAG